MSGISLLNRTSPGLVEAKLEATISISCRLATLRPADLDHESWKSIREQSAPSSSVVDTEKIEVLRFKRLQLLDRRRAILANPLWKFSSNSKSELSDIEGKIKTLTQEIVELCRKNAPTISAAIQEMKAGREHVEKCLSLLEKKRIGEEIT